MHFWEPSAFSDNLFSKFEIHIFINCELSVYLLTITVSCQIFFDFDFNQNGWFYIVWADY